jgi:prepilin-type N-terminal cleavage/methylation domain-containing protein
MRAKIAVGPSTRLPSRGALGTARAEEMRAGFTLIELIISMSIFTVITSFVLVNYRAGARADELRLSADAAATAIREAISLGAASTLANVCVDQQGAKTIQPEGGNCPVGSTLVPQVPNGWGVTFGAQDPGKITVFADLDDNHLMSQNEVVREDKYSQSGMVEATSPPKATIVLATPSQETYVDGARSLNEVSLTLTHQATNDSRAVTYNPLSGKIEVQ